MRQNTSGFLRFSGGTEIENWTEKGQTLLRNIESPNFHININMHVNICILNKASD